MTAASEPKWMPLSLAVKFEPLAKALGVSEVARSPRGFFTQFKGVGGRYAQLDPWWRTRRSNFVERHMAQVRAHGEKLVDDDGMPTRRHLALIMWAYSPFSVERLRKMLREYEQNGAAIGADSDITLNSLERILEPYRDVQLFGHAGTEFYHLLEGSGLVEPLGVGGSRIVVGIGDDLVAKIDMQPEGTTNWEEQAIWEEYGSDLPLAPVLDMRADGRILVMPLAEPVFDKRVPKKYSAELEEGMDLMYQAFPSNEDHRWAFNWGVIDGRVVCIDYAS